MGAHICQFVNPTTSSLLNRAIPGQRARVYQFPVTSPRPLDIPAGYGTAAEAVAEMRGSCLRGAAFALVAETAAGLCFFALWYLWHMAH